MSIQDKALQNLLKKRARLQKTIDDATNDPASYSIQGSVSATARSIQELREELVRIDNQIEALLDPSQNSISLKLPIWRDV